MREELRVQFELRNSYGELRNQLEEWEEDKQWKAKEEMNRRADVERNLPTIPDVEEIDDFENENPNANSQKIEDFNTQRETKDLTLDSPMEMQSSQNFEKNKRGSALCSRPVIHR